MEKVVESLFLDSFPISRVALVFFALTLKLPPDHTQEVLFSKLHEAMHSPLTLQPPCNTFALQRAYQIVSHSLKSDHISSRLNQRVQIQLKIFQQSLVQRI